MRRANPRTLLPSARKCPRNHKSPLCTGSPQAAIQPSERVDIIRACNPMRKLFSRRAVPFAMVCACLFGLVWSSTRSLRIAHAAEDPAAPQAAARKAYADQVRQTYTYLPAGKVETGYGEHRLSLPGNASVEGDDFLQPSAFPTAEYCGHCHQEAYHQWREALHSNSFRTPFYRTSVNLLLQEKGIAFARHCDSCHNPIAVLSGSLDARSTGDRSFDRDGLTCTVCHSVQSADAKLGNGSYVMGVPAVMVDEAGKRIPGTVPDAQILAHPERHSQAVMQKVYQSPEFCSACHKANFPVMLNDYKWIRGFSTYDEWQASKYSRRNPLVFYQADYTTCQGCHMKREAISLPDPGAKHGQLASHRWLAGNTAVPFYYGFGEQLNRTFDFLKTANYLNVDIFGLKVDDKEPLIAPLGVVPFTIKPQASLEAYVVIQSKAIGHSLIPEVRDLYEAWVAFTVTDAQ